MYENLDKMAPNVSKFRLSRMNMNFMFLNYVYNYNPWND